MTLNQAMSLNYSYLGFTSCDRCALNLLRSYLLQAEKPPPGCSQIQQLLRQFKQALDQEGVIRLTIEGQVQVMGKGPIYIILADHQPEVCEPEMPLSFSGYRVWRVTKGKTFDLKTIPTTGDYKVSLTQGETSPANPYRD